ncbi:angiopoietin-1-like isoform X1 [Sparus aurata]|uniref:angiopoietin-1-like isoform X1 n=1 Tax=Sparus aurata TaxID=8175 RepID=UPI0011C17CA2|nr:angiopoietin-1-like isoform X1 [Sparus aurata]
MKRRRWRRRKKKKERKRPKHCEEMERILGMEEDGWMERKGTALENVIQKKMKPDIANIPPHVVHNQTATMLEIGTNLLTHTAEQTRKLNVVEAKVLNQTSRIEIQLLENSLSTNKLEKELLLQTTEISQLRAKNSRLESKVQKLESQQRGELEGMKEEKNRLQSVVRTQMAAIDALERQLRVASSNNTALQRQQAQLMESVHTLINMVATTTGSPPRTQVWRDCADAYKSGYSVSGLYHIYIGNRSEPVQVYCDMETAGGGWTVFQRRFNGSVDFQRSWREYKMGFGDVLGEHWLGNEALFLLTSQGQYSLRVELKDWEGNPAHSQYDRFTLTNERQQYRLYLRGYSGTAGTQSSLASHGTSFSTRDQDNDNCDHCKCALMLTGGWWFDACGFSNLNGIYYTVGHNIRKLNGIKWHHFRGPSYSLRSTSMMVRPYDF